jgi:S1-C subfamily serine protease
MSDRSAGRPAGADAPVCAADPPYPADLPGRRDLSGSHEESRPISLPLPRQEQAPVQEAGPQRPPGRTAGSSALVVALLTALISALAGGLVGGFIGASSAGTLSGYTLGTVPPALTNRPAASVAGIAARVLPSVVMIKVNGGQGTGSGFIVRGGYIVTNNHVVTLDGQATHAVLRVVFDGGLTEPARLVGTDPYSDIAVIRPQHVPRLPVLTLGNSAGVRVGDPVVAFGSPLGLAGTVTSGIVSALNRPVQPSAGGEGATRHVAYDAIQTDAPINPGNSGGPLVNGQAQVIGVTAAIDTLGGDPAIGVQGGSIGLGFAIPSNQAGVVATDLIRTGHAPHSVLGALFTRRRVSHTVPLTLGSARSSSRTKAHSRARGLRGLRDMLPDGLHWSQPRAAGRFWSAPCSTCRYGSSWSSPWSRLSSSALISCRKSQARPGGHCGTSAGSPRTPRPTSRKA